MRLVRGIVENVGDARAMGVRFLRHHLTRRSPDVRVPVKGVGPVTLRRGSSDARVFRQIFTYGQYNLRAYGQWPAIEARYREITDAGRQPLIVDAGANNGASALWFAQQFPAAKVVAIEPEPANVSVLRANTQRFDIEVLPMAIGSEDGSVDLLADGRESWAVATQRSTDGEVRVCTVNDIVERHRDKCDLFMVKIDIEGFESDLFASRTEWVADAKVVMVEPHDWLLPGQGTSRNFQAVLARHDFDILISGDNLIYVQRRGPEPDAEPTALAPVTAQPEPARPLVAPG